MGKNLETVHVRFPDWANDKERYEIDHKLSISIFQLGFQVIVRILFQSANRKDQNRRYYGKDSVVETF